MSEKKPPFWVLPQLEQELGHNTGPRRISPFALPWGTLPHSQVCVGGQTEALASWGVWRDPGRRQDDSRKCWVSGP